MAAYPPKDAHESIVSLGQSPSRDRPRFSNRHSLVSIDVTGHCNLRCVHCYNADFLPCAMPRSSISSILRNTPPSWKTYFLGGEPLARADIFDVLSESVALGHPTSICTNGTLLQKRGIMRLLETGVSEIYVSLDGSDGIANDAIRGDGAFESAIDGLLALDQAIGDSEVSLNISATACRSNTESISRLPQYLDSLGVFIDKLGVMPMSPTGRALAEPDLAITEVEWLNLCEALCENWADTVRVSFLCLANPELAIRYLEAKYRIMLLDSVADCRVARQTDACRVLADGRVAPCSGRLDLLESMETSGDFEFLAATDIASTGDAMPFQDFIDRVQPHLQLNSSICVDCAYKADCQICPLESMHDAEPRMSRLAICEAARARAEDDQLTLATQATRSDRPRDVTKLSGGVVVDNTTYTRELRTGELVVACPRDQSYHVLDVDGSDFWRSISRTRDFGRACAEFLNRSDDPVVGISRLAHLLDTLRSSNALVEVTP